MLFDGTDESLEDWLYAGGGSFVREGCTIKSVGAFGLLYTDEDSEAPYSLKLEWMMPGDDNSGVFVGFPDTGANTDQTSISQGEEIQIDATDNPAQTTGAIYLEQAPDAAARDAALNPPGEWNEYEIVVREDRIVVYLNGVKINEWIDDDPNVDLATGRIGLQTHGAGDDVYFRNVRIRDLDALATSAALDPAEPGPGGTYDGPVGVRLSAAGGAAFTEYRVDGGEWVRSENTAGADPFVTAFTVSAEGEHVVEYRSTNAAGDVEAVQSVAFSIEGAEDPDAPMVQAFADPASGDAPLRVQLSATGLDPQGGALTLPLGVQRGRLHVPAEPGAHVPHAGHVHGDRDGDRSAGQDRLGDRRDRGERAGERRADGGHDRRSRFRTRAAAGAVQRGRDRSRRARARHHLPVGLR